MIDCDGRSFLSGSSPAAWWARTAIFVFGSALFVGLLLALVPDVEEDTRKVIFSVLAACGIALCLVARMIRPLIRKCAIGVLCVVALANGYRFDARQVGDIDYHDVTCYYLGGKYAAELGPFDLYPAVVEADRRNRRWADLKVKYWAQSRDGFERKTLRHALKRGRVVRKTSFEKERWKEFEGDVEKLQDLLGKRRFRFFLVDKGFNATPAWIAYAHPIIEAVPLEHLRILTLLDVGMLGGALLFVAATFGGEAALFSIFFFLVTISTKSLIPGSHILRQDWVAFLLVAMCCLKRSRYGWAGAFTALAGLLRVFPLVWMFGPIAKGAAQMFETKRDQWLATLRRPISMLLVFLATLTVVEGVSLAITGVEMAADHATKMRDHTSPEMISSKRPGFAIALSYNGEVERPRLSDSQRERIRERKPFMYALSGLILLGFGYAFRRKSDVEAFAFGYVPFFLLSTGTYYYHIARITLALCHATQLDRLRHRVSFAFLLLLEIHSQLMFVFFANQQVFWTGYLSWGLLIYTMGSLVWMLIEDKQEQNSPAQPTS